MNADRGSTPTNMAEGRATFARRGWNPALTPVPKRVLMTADTTGGVWTYALELVRALADQEIEIALATMGEPLSPGQWVEAERMCNLGIFESSYKLEWMDEPWADVERAGQWLIALERQLRPDVIHLNNFAHGRLPFHAPKLVVGHASVLSWWRAVKSEEAPESWNTYRAAARDGIQAADQVIAPSRSMLRDLQLDFGPLPPSDIVYNGRQITPFLGPVSAQTSRAPWKESIILSAADSRDEAKNIATLAAVAKHLPWKVVVAGDTTDPSGQICRFENVEWLGKLRAEDLIPWFARAAIYALPARFEPFGFTILEAALSRCALVIGDLPSLREIWGDAALFVNPDDAAGLRSAINRLIADEPLRLELASRAHYRALELSPANMAAGYLAIYSELMRKEHPEPEFICVS